MIKLRVVGTTPEGDALLLSNKAKGRKGSHTLAVDGKLVAVLQGVFDDRRANDRPALTSRSLPTAVEPPRVAPREIQRMLRAGQSVQQVARATGASDGYVEQFYPPVLYERDGVVRDAQALTIEKARLGESGLPVGEAVARNLAQRRVRLSGEELARAWSATRREGEPWRVTLTFPFRGRAHRAVWLYDPRTRELEASNKAASDIGWVAPGARSPSDATPRARTTRRTPAKRKTTGRAPAKRTPTRRKPATRKPAKRAAAKKPAGRARAKPAKRAPAKRAAAKRTATRKPTRKPARRATRRSARKTRRR